MRKRTGLLKRIEKIEQQRSPRRPVLVWPAVLGAGRKMPLSSSGSRSVSRR
jgi:hypothetical protein